MLTGYCTGVALGVTASKENSVLFKMSLTPFYPVSARPLFLLERVTLPPSFYTSFKNIVMMKLGTIKEVSS